MYNNGWQTTVKVVFRIWEKVSRQARTQQLTHTIPRKTHPKQTAYLTPNVLIFQSLTVDSPQHQQLIRHLLMIAVNRHLLPKMQNTYLIILIQLNCKSANLSEDSKIGNETANQIGSKKPQFQFVCMEPTKDQRSGFNLKTHPIASKGESKTDKLLEPATLARILKLQLISRQNNKYHESPIKNKSNTHSLLEIEKIGICGIPSLWVSKEELIIAGHLFKDYIDEQERLESMLRILQAHKKYENDKYYGGSIFKKGGNTQTSPITTVSSNLGNTDFIWFSTENLARLKLATNDKSKDDYAELQLHQRDHTDAPTFKIMQAEAKLVRIILETHGFMQTEQNDWNILWTSTSSIQKQYIYENLHEHQRINHFLNASELTRKDRLCYNVGKLQQKFGKSQFDFLPETYILPDEFPEFNKQFLIKQAQAKSEEDGGDQKNLWIIKPSSSSQGRGIFMVDDISEVPLNEQLVISKYIDNPLLIHGLKFDLRLYVLVTNFDPLKIYVYNEGLVRFASEPYNLKSIKSNVYAHLTNYSINKKSENFVQNQNLSERDFGNKWSLSALQSHLERLGIDMKAVWARIYDSIIKSLISVEGQVVGTIKKVQNSTGGSIKSNCFDIFGFDIILDSDLKPWILEVNLSPSLGFDSPLDFHIKSNLIVDALNIIGIRKFNKKKEAMSKTTSNGSKSQKQQTQYSNTNQPAQQMQMNTIQQATPLNQGDQRKRVAAQSATHNSSSTHHLEVEPQTQSQNLNSAFQNGIDIVHMERLSKISAKHRELLREHLDEFCNLRHQSQTGTSKSKKGNNFTRIFPAPGTNSYDIYFQSEQQQQSKQQWNKVLYRYMYDKTSELQDILNTIAKQIQQTNEKQRKEQESYHHARREIKDNVETQQKQLQMDSSPSPSKYSEDNKLNQSDQFTISKFELASTTTSEVNNNKLPTAPRSQSQMSSIKQEGDDSPPMKTIIVTSSQFGSFSPQNSDVLKRTIGAHNMTKTDSKIINLIDNSSLVSTPIVHQISSPISEYQNEPGKNTACSFKQQLDIKSKSQNATVETTMRQESAPSGVFDINSHSVTYDDRIVVTGDDILIEYVRRSMHLAKQCHNNSIELHGAMLKKLDQFISHKIWQPKDDKKQNLPIQQPSALVPIWQRMEIRLCEMGERKRRLFFKKRSIDISKKDLNHEILEKLYRQQEKLKQDIVKDFSSQELELMLVQSNKNNPIEVVTLLLNFSKQPPDTGSNILNASTNGYGGVLTKLEHFHQRQTKLVQPHRKSSLHVDMIDTDIQLPEGLQQNQHSTPKDKQYQQSILNRLREQGDKKQNSSTSHPPPSSHSSKKEFGLQNNSVNQPIKVFHNQQQMIENTISSFKGIQLQSQQQNAIIGSHSSLLGTNNTQANLSKSNSKAKNQSSFDRSDLVMQTGLTLTYQLQRNGIIANNNDYHKKISLPHINNASNVISGGPINYTHSNTFNPQFQNSNSQVLSQKGGSYLQSNYLQQQALQNYITSGAIANLPSGDNGQSKYRMNKIQTSATNNSSMTPSEVINQKYLMAKSIRGQSLNANDSGPSADIGKGSGSQISLNQSECIYFRQ